MRGRSDFANSPVLVAVAQAAAAATSLQDLSDAALDAMREHLGLQSGAVYSYDRTRKVLDLLASAGPDSSGTSPPELHVHLRPDDRSLIAQSAAEHRVVQGSEVRSGEDAARQEPESTRRVAIPIVWRGEAVGTMSLALPGADEFSLEEIELLQSVARVLGQAFEQARLEDALLLSEAKAEDLIRYAPTGIYRVNFDPPEFTEVNDAMCQLSGYSRDELMGMNPFQILTPESQRRFSERIAEMARGEEAPTDVEYEVVRKDGEHMYVVLKTQFLRDGEGHITGAFVIGHDVTEQRRLLDRLAARERSLQLLSEANSLLLSARNPETVIQTIAERVMRFLNADVFFNYVLDEGAEHLRLNAWGGVDERVAKTIEHLELGQAICGCVARDGERVISRDVQNNDDPRADLVRRMGVTCYVCHPIKIASGTVGTLSFGTKKLDCFSDDDIEFMTTIAEQVSLAVDKRRILQAERASATINQALSSISSELGSTFDTDKAMPSVIRHVMEAAGASGVAIAGKEGDTWTMRHVCGSVAKQEGSRWDASQVPSQELAFARREPVIIPDVDKSEVANRDTAAALGYRSLGIYPLLVRGSAIGTITITFADVHRFDERLATFMSRVTYVISSALENARLYESEHHIAETLQETLVVVPQRLPGVAFSRAYESATSELGRVGGDFVDIFEVRRHIIGIVMGDVSGKGIDAAVITSLVRNTIRAHAIDGLPPSVVCEKTNNVVDRFTEVGAYATLFFGLLNTQSGFLRYVSAGHPPALAVLPDGTIEGLQSDNAILGAFPEVPFRESHEVLRRGERLVLFTDGVTEARRRDGSGFFGEDRLKRVVLERAGESTQSLACSLMDEVKAFSGGLLRDDAALLVVEPTNVEAPGPDHPQLDLG